MPVNSWTNRSTASSAGSILYSSAARWINSQQRSVSTSGPPVTGDEEGDARRGADPDPYPETGRANDAWREGEAGFFFWREREEEDPALSRFKDGLELLIKDRAAGAGLTLKRGTAPFPEALDILGHALGRSTESPFGDLPGVSPLSYLGATGSAGRVADLAASLLEERVWDFAVFAEDPAVIEVFVEMGADVFEGPVGEIPGE